MKTIDTLTELMKKNPGMKVVPNIVGETGCPYFEDNWIGKFGKVRVEEIYYYNGFPIFNDDEGLYDLEDSMLYKMRLDNPGLSKESLKTRVRELIEAVTWTKYIVVDINWFDEEGGY